MRDQIPRRMQQVQARARSMEDLATALRAELVLSPSAVRRQREIPQVRAAIAELRRATPIRPEPLQLARRAFDTIVDVIDAH